MNSNICIKYLGLLALLLLVASCGSDNTNSDSAALSNSAPSENEPASSMSYRISVSNITNSQPLSPLAVIVHSDNYRAWEVGLPASVALEVLAEGGDPGELVRTAANNPEVLAAAKGVAPIPPGANETIDVTFVESNENIYLTVATMLVHTNDGFGGVNAEMLTRLNVGDSLTLMAPAFDAGTEINSENAASIPGPAVGGEGFNPAREDINFVHIHSGILSSQDGLNDSALAGAHRWDNPVLKIVVTRTS